MLPAKEKNFTDVVDVGEQVPAEDKNIVDIDKTELDPSDTGEC